MTTLILFSDTEYKGLTSAKFNADILMLKETNMTWREFYNRASNINLIVPKSNECSYTQKQLIHNYIYNGKLFEIKFIMKLNPNLKIDIYDLDVAASEGHLDLIYWFIKECNVMPTTETANGAARNGHIDVLIMLANNLNILPDKNGLYFATMNSHINILKFGVQHNIIPDASIANLATTKGQIDIVEFLLSLTPPVLPDSISVNMAAEREHNRVLQLLAKHRVFPSLNRLESQMRIGLIGHLTQLRL